MLPPDDRAESKKFDGGINMKKLLALLLAALMVFGLPVQRQRKRRLPTHPQEKPLPRLTSPQKKPLPTRLPPSLTATRS